MSNVRVNVFVTGKHPRLRDHLAGYGRAAGERLKLLATIGAMISSPTDQDSVPVLKPKGGNVLRLNVRLSGAFQEITEQLGFVTSRSGLIVRLADRGLEFSHSPVEQRATSDKKEKDEFSAEHDTTRNCDDMDRIGLAAGLLNDATIWR